MPSKCIVIAHARAVVVGEVMSFFALELPYLTLASFLALWLSHTSYSQRGYLVLVFMSS